MAPSQRYSFSSCSSPLESDSESPVTKKPKLSHPKGKDSDGFEGLVSDGKKSVLDFDLNYPIVKPVKLGHGDIVDGVIVIDSDGDDAKEEKGNSLRVDKRKRYTREEKGKAKVFDDDDDDDRGWLTLGLESMLSLTDKRKRYRKGEKGKEKLKVDDDDDDDGWLSLRLGSVSLETALASGSMLHLNLNGNNLDGERCDWS